MLAASDIKVTHYPFFNITSFRLREAINEHSELQIAGGMAEKESALLPTGSDQTLEIALGEQAVLYPTLTRQNISPAKLWCSLEAKSGSILVDRKPVSSTYQNKQGAYREIFAEIDKRYKDLTIHEFTRKTDERVG